MLRIWNQWVWISSPKLHSAALNVWQVEANQEEDVSFGEVKRAFFFFFSSTENWKDGAAERLKDDRCWERRCGHCHACCQLQREWCLLRRQLVSLREKKTCSGERRERKRDQTFTSEYLWSRSTQISRHIFCGFQECGGREGGVWYLVTHTHSQGSQTSVWVFADTFRYSHMRSVSPRGNEMGGKKKEMKKKGK